MSEWLGRDKTYFDDGIRGEQITCHSSRQQLLQPAYRQFFVQFIIIYHNTMNI